MQVVSVVMLVGAVLVQILLGHGIGISWLPALFSFVYMILTSKMISVRVLIRQSMIITNQNRKNRPQKRWESRRHDMPCPYSLADTRDPILKYTLHNEGTINSSTINNVSQEITLSYFDGQLSNASSNIISNQSRTTNSSSQHINTPSTIAFNNSIVQPIDFLKVRNDSMQCRNCTCGKKNRIKRIVGGEVAERNEFPWMVMLKWVDDSTGSELFFCGAIVITKQHLLTAAHCLYNPIFRLNAKEITAWLGAYSIVETEPNEITFGIEEIILHPRYEMRMKTMILTWRSDILRLLPFFKYDIAILKLNSPISFDTPHIQPACLPKSENEDYTGFVSISSGWGVVNQSSQNNSSPHVLQKVELPIISLENCRKNYSYLLLVEITDSMMCTDTTGGKGTCQGDSGGPLQISVAQSGIMEVVGITSWGHGCGVPNQPAVYTRIASYIPWIYKNIAGECLCRG